MEAFVNQEANNTGKLENFLSLSILLVLTTIATLIFLQQFRYSPAILQDDQMASYPAGQPASPETQQFSVLLSVPQKLTPLSPPEVFGPLNLSDKIDGKAGLYLSAGFPPDSNVSRASVSKPTRIQQPGWRYSYMTWEILKTLFPSSAPSGVMMENLLASANFPTAPKMHYTGSMDPTTWKSLDPFRPKKI
jgi:hypothetical protein